MVSNLFLLLFLPQLPPYSLQLRQAFELAQTDIVILFRDIRESLHEFLAAAGELLLVPKLRFGTGLG